VAHLGSGGETDFILADQSLNQVTIQHGGTAPSVFQDQSNGLLAPSAVQLVPGTGARAPDLVIANSGGNDVLVYQYDAASGQYLLQQTCYVGTDPVGLTVADVNGDGLPDVVVADKGSNDVAIL